MPQRANVWALGFITTMTRLNNRIVIFVGLCLASLSSAEAQTIDLHPNRTKQLGQPVEVYRLAGDTLVSSFLIYVNDQVKPHYHAEHSEHVYVLEGRGTMTMDDSVFTVNPGDFIFIPQGTVHSAARISEEPLKVISIQAPFFDGKDRIMSPPKK